MRSNLCPIVPKPAQSSPILSFSSNLNLTYWPVQTIRCYHSPSLPNHPIPRQPFLSWFIIDLPSPGIVSPRIGPREPCPWPGELYTNSEYYWRASRDIFLPKHSNDGRAGPPSIAVVQVLAGPGAQWGGRLANGWRRGRKNGASRWRADGGSSGLITVTLRVIPGAMLPNLSHLSPAGRRNEARLLFTSRLCGLRGADHWSVFPVALFLPLHSSLPFLTLDFALFITLLRHPLRRLFIISLFSAI